MLAHKSRRDFPSAAITTLYQYAICPYCNISKALLHYTGTPYNAVEVNPLTKAELKSLPDQDYKKVPIMLQSDRTTQINGSKEIASLILATNPTIDSSSESALQWTAFARDDLAPLLYPNLCNSLSSSYHAFGYVHSTPSFSISQRYSIQFLGSIAMYLAASKIKQKRNITDERVALKEALGSLEAALDGASFLSNTRQPHLGDLSVYGVLRALRGLPVMSILEDYPMIIAWFSQMELVVEDEAN
jgi:microsomal prostaglandin-E synthase 2